MSRTTHLNETAPGSRPEAVEGESTNFQDYTNMQATNDYFRHQALETATHLSCMPCFEGAKAKSSSPLDIRSLFERKSAAADSSHARPKLEGRAIVLTSTGISERKGFKPQEMSMLAVDFDVGNLSLQRVRTAAQGFFGDSIATAFSTASSSPEKKRWRLFVPLMKPVMLDVWLRLLRAFAHYLVALDLTVDVTAERATQLHFLPNVGWTALDKDTGCEIATRDPVTVRVPGSGVSLWSRQGAKGEARRA